MEIRYYENNNEFNFDIKKIFVRNYENKLNVEVVYNYNSRYSLDYEKSVYFDKIPTLEEIINTIREEENYMLDLEQTLQAINERNFD